MNKESVIHDFIEHCMMVESKNIDSYIWDLNDVRNEVKKYLSQQKPRTKTEFVKVEFEKLSDAAIAVDTGEIYYTNYGEQAVVEYGLALHYYNTGNLKFYRKVETEIDERQEFIDTYASLRHEFHGQRTYDDFSGFMYDSGKFKLVEN